MVKFSPISQQRVRMKPSTPHSRKPSHPSAAAATAAVSRLHPNNPHQGRYDLDALTLAVPALQSFFITTPRGDTSIDFSNAKAVLCLNQALLKQFYGIEHWSLPQGFLCPPIPGRADYVHHAADLLELPYKRPVNAPTQAIRALDIGTGANLIYPIIATRALGWQMVGSDISSAAIANANNIVIGDYNIFEQGVSLGSDKISVAFPPQDGGEGNTQAFNIIPIGNDVAGTWVSSSYVYDTGSVVAITGLWEATDAPLDTVITNTNLYGFVPAS